MWLSYMNTIFTYNNIYIHLYYIKFLDIAKNSFIIIYL